MWKKHIHCKTRNRWTTKWLTIYHKSASGEVLNSCAVWCRMKRERETDVESETWAVHHGTNKALYLTPKQFYHQVSFVEWWQPGGVIPHTPPWSRSPRHTSSGWCAGGGQPHGWLGAADLFGTTHQVALASSRSECAIAPGCWCHCPCFGSHLQGRVHTNRDKPEHIRTSQEVIINIKYIRVT